MLRRTVTAALLAVGLCASGVGATTASASSLCSVPVGGAVVEATADPAAPRVGAEPVEGIEIDIVAVDDDGPYAVLAGTETGPDGSWALRVPCQSARVVVRATDPIGFYRTTYGGGWGTVDWRMANTYVPDGSYGWGQDIALTPPARYVPVEPTRVLDTRADGGRPLGQWSRRVFTVPDLPPGTTAVVLNLTSTQGTAASYLTAYQPARHAIAPPTTSSLNSVPGRDVANLVTVPVQPDGSVTLYNDQGTVHVAADLQGYYSTLDGAGFVPVAPVRALDTRRSVPLGHGATRSLVLAGPGAPVTAPPGAVAAALTVTSTAPTAATSFVSAYPSDAVDGRSSSVLNAYRGDDVPNLAIVPLGPDGAITLYNDQGSTHLVVDVVGWYVESGGAFFHPVDAVRSDGSGPLGAGQSRAFAPGSDELPDVLDGSVAVALNLTTTAATARSYLTVHPSGMPRPLASNANTRPGADVASATITAGPGGFDVYNDRGTVRALVDVWGFFVAP